MLLMPILPMMLIGTILVAGALDRRGLFGEPHRKVAVGVPLAAIAAGLSLAAAAIQFAGIGVTIAQDRALGIYFLGVAWFQVIWSLAHLVARNAVSALIGIVGNGLPWACGSVHRRSGCRSCRLGSSPVSACATSSLDRSSWR